MERIKDVFTDFKISSSRGPNLAGCLETAAELGYKRVAIDVQVQVTHRTTPLPPARELDEQLAAVTIPKGLEVLKRLTVILDDPNILHSVQGSNVLDQYDITALHCTNDKVFQVAVTSLTTDIVSLEWGERLGYALRRTQISQIIGRGIVFELCYTPAIKDSSQRCHIISNALHLASISKGKVIVTFIVNDKSMLGGAHSINLYNTGESV
jgi:ribonuclease P/MRP protein subunit RPP1